MKKNKIIILIVLISLSFFGLLFYSSRKIYENKIIPVSENKKTDNSPLKITELSFKDEVAGETNVYDFMKDLEKNGKISFKDKNYIGMGKLITEINGIKGNGEKNWIYYVNGVEAQVGVSNYKINKGDVVSWKYEKSNY